MNTVIPYNEKLSTGAFITPKHGIELVNNCHEIYAYNYCCGNNKNLECKDMIFDNNYLGKLSKEQLELCKIWLEKFKFGDTYSDSLVLILGFDKIQTVSKKSIITTSNIPHIKYYNYYLMDWYIEQFPKMKFNKTTGLFEPENISDFIYNFEDRNAEEEINEIKSKVLKKDIPYFFK